MATDRLEEFTLPALMDRSARLFAKQPSLGFVDETPLTYKELKAQIEQLSAFLTDQDISPGDRIALIGENSPQWGIVYFAVTGMGAVIVPILPDFHISEVHHIIKHSGSKIVFVSERFYHKVAELPADSVKSLVLLDDFSVIAPATPKATLLKLIANGGKELKKIRNLALKTIGRLSVKVKEDDLASLIYTSGTTGFSKGVMLTHKNIVANAFEAAKIPPVGPQDRLVSILPLAHVYECTLGLVLPIMQGASVTYLRKPPTPTVLLPALAKVKPTVMLTVPLIIEKIYRNRILPELNKKAIVRTMMSVPMLRKKIRRAAGKKLMATFGGKLTFFGVGGAALAPDVEDFLREAGFPYAIGYGLTETSPLIAGANAANTRFRSTGPVVHGLDVRIDNPDPKTGEGEIQVRGPYVMKGYYRDEERTAESFTADGWFKTGDLGSFDKDGYLYIKGRIKSMLLGPNGENIYPEPIEALINQFDYVLDSLVIQDKGALVALVHLDHERLDRELTDQGASEAEMRKKIEALLVDLRTQVNARVAGFSRISRFVEQREPFEKTPTQKIKRYLYVKK